MIKYLLVILVLASPVYCDDMIGDSITGSSGQNFSVGYSYIFDSTATFQTAWYTAVAGDTITSVGCRGKLGSGTICSLQVYLYTVVGTTLTDSITVLDTLLVSGSDETAIWSASDVNYGLTAGVKYTIAGWAVGGAFRTNTTASTNAMRYNSGSVPNPWATSGSKSYRFPMWANVTSHEVVSTASQVIIIH